MEENKYRVVIPAKIIDVCAPDETTACQDAEEIAGGERGSWTIINLNEGQLACPHCGVVGNIVEIIESVTIKYPIVGTHVVTDAPIIIENPKLSKGYCRCDSCYRRVDIDDLLSDMIPKITKPDQPLIGAINRLAAAIEEYNKHAAVCNPTDRLSEERIQQVKEYLDRADDG